MEIDFVLYMLLFAVAVLYAAVGHGGASGYIAVMSLWGIMPEIIRPVALLLNTLVALLAFQRYYQAGFFRWRLLLPFLLTSVPMAYLGGSITVETKIFNPLLGFLLLVPVLNLVGIFRANKKKRELHVPLALCCGGAIGFLSGLLGIGGGILLSPLLLLAGWATVKESAAVSALFIFLNSLTGLAAMSQPFAALSATFLPIPLLVVAGGWLGAHVGAFRLNPSLLRYVLALVLLVAAGKLIFVAT